MVDEKYLHYGGGWHPSIYCAIRCKPSAKTPNSIDIVPEHEHGSCHVVCTFLLIISAMKTDQQADMKYLNRVITMDAIPPLRHILL